MVRPEENVNVIVEQPKGASVGQVPALLTIVRLGWNALSKTNTLAYYKHSQMTDFKSFHNIGTWAQCYKTFCGRDL